MGYTPSFPDLSGIYMPSLEKNKDFRMLLLRHIKNGYLVSGLLGIVTPIIFVTIKHFFFGHPVHFYYQTGIERTITLVDKLFLVSIASILVFVSKKKFLSLQAHRYLFITLGIIYSFVMLSDDIMNMDVNFSSGYQTLLLLIAATCIPFRPTQFFIFGLSITLLLYPGLLFIPGLYGIDQLQFYPNQVIHLSIAVFILTGVSAFLYNSRYTTYSLRKKNQDFEDEDSLIDSSTISLNNQTALQEPGSENRISSDERYSVTDVEVKSQEEIFFEKVKEVIEEHMSDTNFGVEWLAYEVSISPRQLQRRLKAYPGVTAGTLIRIMRMNRAAQLIEGHAGTISEIAYKSGFNDPAHFSSLFKKLYGMTPTEYVNDSSE